MPGIGIIEMGTLQLFIHKSVAGVQAPKQTMLMVRSGVPVQTARGTVGC